MIRQADNCTTAGTIFAADAPYFEVVDAMPQWLRRMAWEGLSPFDIREGLKYYQRARMAGASERAAREYAAEIYGMAEAAEVQALDQDYRRRFGVPLPHVAAGATILRYGSFEA